MQFPQSMLNDAAKITTDNLKNAISSIKGNPSKSPKAIQRLAAYEFALSQRDIDVQGDFSDDNESDTPFDLIVAKKYQQLYQSAMKRGKEWNLSLSDIKKLLTRKTCHYTGIKLTKAKRPDVQFTDLTVDRLDATKGYVKGNVFAICHGANQLKNMLFESNGGMGFDLEEIQKLLSSMAKLRGRK